ncbi:MAG: hypothetical protein ACFB10_22590 [Salibacteraceae bacterium]
MESRVNPLIPSFPDQLMLWLQTQKIVVSHDDYKLLLKQELPNPYRVIGWCFLGTGVVCALIFFTLLVGMDYHAFKWLQLLSRNGAFLFSIGGWVILSRRRKNLLEWPFAKGVLKIESRIHGRSHKGLLQLGEIEAVELILAKSKVVLAFRSKGHYLPALEFEDDTENRKAAEDLRTQLENML